MFPVVVPCSSHNPSGSSHITHLQGPNLLLRELRAGRTLCPQPLEPLCRHIDHRLQYLQIFPQLLLISSVIGHHTHSYTHTAPLFSITATTTCRSVLFCSAKTNKRVFYFAQEIGGGIAFGFLLPASAMFSGCGAAVVLKQTTVDGVVDVRANRKAAQNLNFQGRYDGVWVIFGYRKCC